jgi:hypothetical protein
MALLPYVAVLTDTTFRYGLARHGFCKERMSCAALLSREAALAVGYWDEEVIVRKIFTGIVDFRTDGKMVRSYWCVMPAPSPGPVPMPAATRRLLVVEDEPLIAATMVDQLEGLGYTVLGPVNLAFSEADQK